MSTRTGTFSFGLDAQPLPVASSVTISASVGNADFSFMGHSELTVSRRGRPRLYLTSILTTSLAQKLLCIPGMAASSLPASSKKSRQSAHLRASARLTSTV